MSGEVTPENVWDNVSDSSIVDLFEHVGDAREYYSILFHETLFSKNPHLQMLFGKVSERYTNMIPVGFVKPSNILLEPGIQISDLFKPYIEGVPAIELGPPSGERFFMHTSEDPTVRYTGGVNAGHTIGGITPEYTPDGKIGGTIDPLIIKVPSPDSPDPGKDRAALDFFKVWRDNQDMENQDE